MKRQHWATGKTAPRKPKADTTNAKGGHNRRAVIVHGRTYPSIRACTSALHINGNTIYDWLSNGKAKYL